MTYSEYRHSFATTEEFMKVFGKLSEEEANALISATNVVRLSIADNNAYYLEGVFSSFMYKRDNLKI